LDALGKMLITQAELANRLQCKPTTCEQIIKGQENLTLETIAKIGEVLGGTLIAVPKNEIHNAAETQIRSSQLYIIALKKKAGWKKISCPLSRKESERQSRCLLCLYSKPLGKGERSLSEEFRLNKEKKEFNTE
jgi:DNA-binding XRE family transcriptional regulator